MLAPHHRVDAQLRVVRLSPEYSLYLLILLGQYTELGQRILQVQLFHSFSHSFLPRCRCRGWQNPSAKVAINREKAVGATHSQYSIISIHHMPVEVYRCILIITLRVDRSAWYKQQNQNEPANSPTTPHDSCNEFDNRSRITRVKKLTPLPLLSQHPLPAPTPVVQRRNRPLTVCTSLVS